MELPILPPRPRDSHKGDFGRALIVGGSRGMAGAAALAGMAATRAGAGLTTVATADGCLETVAGFDPNFMTVPLPDDAQGRIGYAAVDRIRELGQSATSLALGPGLAQSDELVQLVSELYTDITKPMVIDADGLNALSRAADVLSQHQAPRILTPHIGEFRRLLASQGDPSTTELSVSECRAAAQSFAAKHGIVLVLKGHQTIVTDGQTIYNNQTGNPGMATGGSGDVLTGVIAALLGQNLSALESAVLGVHVHGFAGDNARDRLGEVSMTAGDIIDGLPSAFLSLPRA